ncbi:hypothetical protein NC653_014239 [Populus alba x Populus x berolinensis]|uniref:Uncharacterized protein n=1 Tax=Populus alba x Populus x berolinensis TaxID=444605 RepID=A0AAD6W3K0_9ROSI|nr:hypothetical protein NC653_014239 [Populus alba x Populus x berolinensis]
MVMDTWLAYAPVKNSPEDAAKEPDTDTHLSCYFLSLQILYPNMQTHYEVFNGQEVEVWPRIVWKPKWGLTFADIRSKVSASCSITRRSTMAIKGRNILGWSSCD